MTEIPEEMSAWVIREDRHGDPRQAMRLERTSLPRIGPNDVLVSVMAAGINFNGVWLCHGKPVPLSRLHTGYDFQIAGSDASGTVCKVGEAVRHWKPGDAVVVHCNVSCGQCPLCAGFDPLACEEQKIWGYETNWGSFAPFAKVQAQQLLHKPPHLTWEESASYGLCLFTAYRMLISRARIQPQENVLVWGGAGGLGVFAIQLCKLAGANPICVVSSDEKAEFCRRLGAEATINRTHFDLSTAEGIREFGREIRRLTKGHDPDVVFEHVGKDTFRASVYVCRKFGRIVMCGATSGYDVGFDARYLWMRQKSIIGSHFANSYDGERANRLVLEKKVHPVLRDVFPFESVPEAQALQAELQRIGKIAVLVQAERAGLGATS